MSGFQYEIDPSLLDNAPLTELEKRATELNEARARITEKLGERPLASGVVGAGILLPTSTTTADSIRELAQNNSTDLAGLADRLNAEGDRSVNGNTGFVPKTWLQDTNPFVRFPAYVAEAAVGVAAGANREFNNLTALPAYQYANFLESKVPAEVRKEFETNLNALNKVDLLRGALTKLKETNGDFNIADYPELANILKKEQDQIKDPNANNTGDLSSSYQYLPDGKSTQFRTTGRDAFYNNSLYKMLGLSPNGKLDGASAQLNIQDALAKLEVVTASPRSIALMNAINPQTGKPYRETLQEARNFRMEANAMRGKDESGKDLPTSTNNWTNNEDMQFIQTSIANDPEILRIQQSEMSDNRKAMALYGRALTIAGAYALQQPSMIPQEIAKSAIFLLLPKASAVAYGSGMVQDLENAFRSVNGAAPTGEERLKMAAWATAAAGLSAVTNTALVNSLTGAGRNAGTQAANTLLGSVARTGAATAKPGLMELGEETFQSYVESGAGYGEAADPIQMGIGGAIGGLSGAAIGSVPGGLRQAATEISRRPANIAAQEAAAEQEALNQIPIEELRDAKSANYNPLAAIQRFTTEFTQAGDLEQKTAILQNVEDTITEMSEDIAFRESNIAKIPKAKADLAGMLTLINADREAKLATVTDPAIAQLVNDRYDSIVTKWEGLAKADVAVETENLNAQKQRYAKAQELAKPLRSLKAPKTTSQYDSSILNYPTDENAMKALTLADDMSLDFTDEQRANLRLFSEAVVMANKAKSMDVVTDLVGRGGKDSANQKFFGLKEYMRDMAKAVKGGDNRTQDTLLARMAKFRDSHSQKSKFAAETLARTTRETAFIIAKSGDEWVVTQELPRKEAIAKQKEVTANGGLVIAKGYSDALVKRMVSENENIGIVEAYLNNIKTSDGSTTKPIATSIEQELAELNANIDSMISSGNIPTNTNSEDVTEEQQGEEVDNVVTPEVVNSTAPVVTPVPTTPTSTPTATKPIKSAVLTEDEQQQVIDTILAWESDTNPDKASLRESFQGLATSLTGRNISTSENSKGESVIVISKGNDSIAIATNDINTTKSGNWKKLEWTKATMNNGVPVRVEPEVVEEEVTAPTPSNSTPTPTNTTATAVADRIVTKSGKPFANEKTAKAQLTKLSLADTYEVTKVEGGFAITRKVAPVKPTKKERLPDLPQLADDITDETNGNKPYVIREAAEAALVEKKLSRTHRVVQLSKHAFVIRRKDTAKGLLSVLDVDDNVKAAEQEKIKTDYRSGNLVTAFFTQKVKNGLNSISNFIKTLGDSIYESAMEYLEKDNLTKNEIASLKMLTELHEVVQTELNTALIKSADDYRWRDYLRFLFVKDAEGNDVLSDTGSPVLDENVYTAIAASMMTWITENNNSFNDAESIASMFGNAMAALNVTGGIQYKYGKMGGLRTNVIRELGSKVYETLGLKLDSDADSVHKERLINAFGAATLEVLVNKGYVAERQINTIDYLADASVVLDKEVNNTGFNEYAQITFIRAEGDKANAVAASQKESGNIVSKLLGVPTYLGLPSKKPITKVNQTTIDNLGTEIPSALIERILAIQSTAHKIDGKLMDLYISIYEKNAKALYTMFGYKKITDEMKATNHKSVIEETEAVNDDIIRAVSNMMTSATEMRNEDGTYSEFYLPVEVWSINRVGVTSNAFNEQGNKIHRSVYAPANQTVEIDLTQEPLLADGTITTFGRFLLGLGSLMEEAPLSVKKTPDKTNAAKYIPSIQEYLRTPKVLAAVEAMSRLMKDNGSATQGDVKLITAMVAEFGMGALSVQALTNLVAIHETQLAKQTKVSVTVGFESDGVNNGVVLSELIYGTASISLLNAGGLYEEGDIQSITQYKADSSNLDYYEQLGALVKKLQNAIISTTDALFDLGLVKQLGFDRSEETMTYKTKQTMLRIKATLPILMRFDPAFGERKGAKTIAVPFNYGAKIQSISNKIASDVINGFYKQIVAANNNGNQKLIGELVLEMNKILGSDSISKIEDPVNFEFSNRQIKAIRKVVQQTRGKVVSAALESMAEDLIVARNRLVAIAQTGAVTYNMLRNQMIEARYQEMLAAKTLPGYTNSKGVYYATQYLPDAEVRAIEKELAKYDSRIVSAIGSISDNPMTSGHPTYTSKNVSTLEGATVATYNQNEHKFVLTGSTKPHTVRTYSNTTERTDRGVGISAAVIQGTDAAVSTKVTAQMKTTNHHDANTSGVDVAGKMGELQNNTLVETLLTYHLGEHIFNSLLNPLKGLLALGGNIDGMLDTFVASYGEHLSRTAKFDTLTKVMGDTLKADIAKLEILRNLKYINQYGTEQGHYTMTDADVKLIDKTIEQLEQRNDELLKKLATITAALKVKANANDVKVEVSEEVEPFDTNTTNDIITTKTVKISVGKNKKQPEIIKILRDIQKLQTNAFNKKLIETLIRRLPTDVTLNVINDRNDKNSIGVFFGSEKAIYINIGHKAYTNEVFVHEVVHAVTAIGINEKSKNSEILNKELNEIRDLLEKADTSNLTPHELGFFKYALSNNDELLATVFTKQFMRNILRSIPVKKGNKLYNTLDKLKTAIATFLGFKAEESNLLDRFINVGSIAIEYGSTTSDQYSIAPELNKDVFNYPTEEAFNAVSDYTSTEVFTSLNGNLDSQFEQNLNDTMLSVVNKSYDVLQQFGLIGGREFSPDTLWTKAKLEGRTIYTSSLLAMGFSLSDKEAFAVETIEASVRAAINNGFTTPTYKELRKAYESAKNTLKVEDFHNGDWATATNDEKTVATNKRNALFGGLGSSNTTTNDYMARFIALGLGSQDMAKLLSFSTKKVTNPNKPSESLFDTVVEYLNKAMDWVNGYLTKTLNTDSVNLKLGILAIQLIDIDANARKDVMSGLEATLETAQNRANDVGKVLSEKAADMLQGLTETKPAIIGGTAKLTQTVLRGKFEEVVKLIQDWRNTEHPNSLLGWKAEALIEALTPDAVVKGVNRMIRKYGLIQETRQRIIEEMTKNINGAFSTELTRDDRKAITNILLRNTSYNLLDAYGINGIKEFLTDKVKLNQEIKKLSTELLSLPLGNLMLVRVKDLASYQVTREGKEGLAKNTDAIAAHVGTTKFDANYSKSTVELLNKLTALYAYSYSDKKQISKVSEILNTDDKAIVEILKFQQSLDRDSRDTLFQGNYFSIVQGYLPEVTNTHKEIRVANSKEEATKLEKLGFVKSHTLKVDANDSGESIDGTRIIYVAKESSRERYVSGAMSLNTAVSSGTTVFADKADALQRFKAIKAAAAKTELILAKKAKDPNYDPRKSGNAIIPRYGQDGKIRDYMYEMNGNLRDDLLDRENDFAILMGQYAGSNFDKVNAPKHNNIIIDMLHNDYVNNFAKDPNAFIVLTPDSKDPRMVELYRTIPEATREHAKELWGGSEFVVRNSIITPTFGYEKFSAASAFEKNSEMRTAVEKLYVGVAEMFLPNARLKVLRADRAWTETVAFIKDVIVIRNLKTLIGNQIANMGILSVIGVSPLKIVSRSLFAIRAGLQYRRDMAIKTSLQQRIAANNGNIGELMNQLSRVEDSMSRNPLKDFIAEGLLPSYVEDLEVVNDSFSYKARMSSFLDSNTQFIPSPVKEAGKYLIVSPSTPLYKFLSNATQFSDFTAKFVLYEHLMNRKNNPMNREDALDAADTMFINYGVPTSKFLQALNDRGIIMFTKYYIRIQRAILFLLKEHPTSAIAQTLLAAYAGVAGSLSPSLFLNVGNPFGLGALNLPTILDEPIPMKLILGD